MPILLERHEQCIRKYISNCTLCLREKDQVQSYPLQMTEIPEGSFDKIAIDMVTECETSTSGNKHILNIIDHLTVWPEALPILDKSAHTIVSTFINHYLPVHMCGRYILSDNGTEFKNQLMDQVLQQFGIDCIFSAPYHLQSNGKLEVFHKYLKPKLKKLCEQDPPIGINTSMKFLLATEWHLILPLWKTSFFLVCGRDQNLPLQLLEPMQCFLGDPESGLINLKAHWLTLAILKKTLDENHFRTAQITMDREPTSFKIGDRVYFKNNQEKGISSGDLDTGLFVLSMMNTTCLLKIRPHWTQHHATEWM